MKIVQLTPEWHKFELYRPTYMWIFSVNILVDCGDSEKKNPDEPQSLESLKN